METMRKILSSMIIFSALSTAAYSRGAVPYIFHLPTAETYGKRILLFDVGHRYFDPVKHYTNVNISAGYGIIDSLDIDIGFSFKNNDLVYSLKYTPLRDDTDQNGALSVSIMAGGGYKVDTEKLIPDSDQPSFFTGLIMQRHFFKNRMSIGLVPLFAWNTNFYEIESSYDFSLGLGSFVEVYFVDRFSVCAEVAMNFYGFAFKYMNYNVGFKYAGYRHTFSLWISNSSGYSPVEYLAGSTTLEPRVSFAATREFDL